MKIKPSVVLAVPLATVVVSVLVYLLLSDPTPLLEPDRRHVDANGGKLEHLPASVQDVPTAILQQEASSTPGERLLQKYAESEMERQKEIADAQKPVVVPPPLALVETGSEMGLNEAQAMKLAELRQSFIEGLAKVGKPPESPEYLEYWTREQAVLDEQVRLHLGEDIFLQLSARGFAALNSEQTGQE